MPALNLASFSVGETGYVAKMNANNQAIVDYLAAYETAQNNLSSSAAAAAASQSVQFGSSPAVFNDASYRTQALGSDLIVAAGTAWAPSQQIVTTLLSGDTISMSAQPAGTYYVNAVNGSPQTKAVVSTIARDPLYSFTWNGLSITNIRRMATVFTRIPRGPEDVEFAASLALDFGRSEHLRLRLTGDAAIYNMLAAYDGQRCILEVTQDGTGGRTLTAPAIVRIGSDVAWSISAGPNTRTHLGLVYSAPAGRFDLVACARGF